MGCFIVIRKLPGQAKWRLYGTKTGKNLGTFPSKVKAAKHEKEVRFFMYGRKK